VQLKLFIFCLFCFFFVSTTFSQQYQYVYYFDKDLNPCSKANAIVSGKGFNDNGLIKVDYFVNQTDFLLMSVHYSDSALNMPQGLFQSYYINAVLEKEGNYDNGEMQGLWQQYDKKGLKTDSIIYEKGIRVKFASFIHGFKSNGVANYSFTDSLQNTYEEKNFSEDGVLQSEVYFYRQKGLFKSYGNNGVVVKTDSVFTREKIEPEFPGGDVAWGNFLKKNLNALVPSEKGAPNGTYTAIVTFVVTTDGSLDDITAESSAGFGAEAELIRVIKKSPKWKPGKQFGRYVNILRKQPSTFLVQ